MNNRKLLALLVPISATILLLAGCPSPNNAAAAPTVSNTTALVGASPNQPAITVVPAASETASSPAITGAQVSAPPPNTFEDIFIPDCCEPELPAS